VNSLSQEICSECDALWHSYGDAAAEHLKLLARARGAAITPTEEQSEAIELAEHRRTAVRDAIYRHVVDPLHGPPTR
jgi:hypothetical protein